MSKSELTISRWLEAHSDRNANLFTFPRGAILSNLCGDGDYRLILTDIKLEKNTRSRLKVYKGTVLVSDQVLADIPSGIISFYTDNLEPKIPAIGVACNSELLIYKNNKPFYKFTLPPVPLASVEQECWRKFEEGTAEFAEILEELRTVPFGQLSGRSQELLTLPGSKVEEFVNRCKSTKPVKCNTIVCATSLNKYSQDANGIACPVLATENGMVYVLDPQTYAILHQANICNTKSTPVAIQTSGLFDVDYRIVIACREFCVCILRRGWLEGKIIIQTIENIVDILLTPGDHFVLLATATKTLHCHNKKGQKLWSVATVNPITCLCLVPLKHLSSYLIAVGMKGGSIHLYHGREMVDYTNVPDTPSTILFGQMGQEEHVMVAITMAGTINFKILKRTADFNLTTHDKTMSHSTIALNKPLPLPKRSKLFLEQSARERENATEIHQKFQQDLIRLRLSAARTLVDNLSDHSGTGNVQEQVKLSAQVLGLGPKFTLILNLENMNSDKPIDNFTVIFHADTKIYQLSNYVIIVPLIPPSLNYKMETKVTEITDEQPVGVDIERIIRVFVNRKQQAQPVLAATINMPVPELF